MKAWRCSECSGMWGLALLRCPRCRTNTLEEESVPKISRAAGASNAGSAPAATVRVKQVLSDREAKRLRDRVAGDSAAAEPSSTPAAAADQMEGGERPSVGSSSAASSGKLSPSSPRSGRGSRKRAQTTENPSSGTPTGTSTAPSTATGGPSGSATSGTDDGEEGAS